MTTDLLTMEEPSQKVATRMETDPSVNVVDERAAAAGEVESEEHWYDEMIKKGAKYVGPGGDTLEEQISKHLDSRLYFLHFNQESETKGPERWNGNIRLFCQALERKEEGCQFFIVDGDHHTLVLESTGLSSCVQIAQGGKILAADLLKELKKPNEIPVAQSTSPITKIRGSNPSKKVPLVIPCTGKNCDSTKTHEWTCRTCKEVLEYGFDGNAYCNCGRTEVTGLKFLCTDPEHGFEFEKHDDDLLKAYVESLQPLKELNILILGETGVGKSTWINAFVNFLTYESLDEAEKGPLVSLIQSQFTVCDENFDQILVSTGTDDNEEFQTGQSSTQQARVYPFTVGNTIVRLIDTPGIGDTRGVEQDKKNFDNILATLSHHEEIHGICILLKPNNAKLNLLFRFCIKELLTYLHRDASKNLLFCFTNSRGTFYRPGDTMPALKKLLSENKEVDIPVTKETVYCFDSEAYRFLAAIKNDPPVTFPDEEKQNFAESWDRSIKETNRMLKYIQGLKPHSVKSTLNLNHARELVLRLARPLAEINRNIQTNKSIVEEEKMEIKKTKANIEVLKTKQMTLRTEIEVRPINYPKTVCSNGKCVKVWSVNNMKTVEYTTVCHPHCNLEGVAKDTIGDPGLMECEAMSNGKCRHSNCGHSYREHMHVYYDSVQVVKQVKDHSVEEAIQKNLSAKQMKRLMIARKNQEIQEYEEELNRIEEASARFAYFLKHNAITPYNDAIEEYLDLLIQEEKEKVYQGGSRVALINLTKSKQSYLAQKDLLEKGMQKGEALGIVPPGPAEVQQLLSQLQSLKHSGKALREALDCMEHSRKAVYTETVVRHPRRYNSYQHSRPLVSWFGFDKIFHDVGRFMFWRNQRQRENY